jgi:site-specific DNA recombinase
LKLEIDVAYRGITADYAAKRRILEILCLNCSFDGASLVATMRKPFDLLAKGLLQKDSRGDRI